jgi:hypothetical protein
MYDAILNASAAMFFPAKNINLHSVTSVNNFGAHPKVPNKHGDIRGQTSRRYKLCNTSIAFDQHKIRLSMQGYSVLKYEDGK